MTESAVALASLLILNVVAFAYGYGKLTQKVSSICSRLNHLTDATTSIAEKVSDIAERLSRLEGQGGK